MLRETLSHAGLTLYHLSLDIIRFLGSLVRSRSALTAENLFLRKQNVIFLRDGLQRVVRNHPEELTVRQG
jgi:hypothetical protein